MKNLHLMAIASLLLVAMACGKGTQEETIEDEIPKPEEQVRDEMYQRVIEIHDEAMLKMETIMSLKNNAIKEVDSLRTADSLVNATKMADLVDFQIELEEAHNGMMTWMRQFKDPADTVSHEEAMDYLRMQETKIIEVDEQMAAVINKAKEN